MPPPGVHRSGGPSLRPLAVLLASLLLVVPAASASWRGVGTQEPDTWYDSASAWMYKDPVLTGLPVYFDVFPTLGGPGEGSPYNGLAYNPNLGATGSRISPFGLVEYRALLGAWRDCNRDGYIGWGELALQEYRPTLLLDPSLCPTGSPFNDGHWVSEFLMIGMVDPCEFQKDPAYRLSYCSSQRYGLTLTPGYNTVPAFFKNPRVIYANGTFVWGDLGAPGEEPAVECAFQPAPHGTTASTGGALAFADCQDGFFVARTWNAAVSSVDPQNTLQLRFEDPRHPERSSSRLNQPFPVSLFGNPATGAPGLLEREAERDAWSVWDCSRRKGTLDARDPLAPPGQRGPLSTVEVRDPTGAAPTGPIAIPIVGQRTLFEDDDGDPSTGGVHRVHVTDGSGSYAALPATSPGAVDPTASHWDALEAASDGVYPVGDCDGRTSNTLADAYVGSRVEARRGGVAPPGKNTNDFVFFFYDGYRGLNERIDHHTHTENVPTDGGVAYTRNIYGGAMWSATAARVTDPQFLDRTSLSPSSPRYATFYARLHPAAIAEFNLVPPTINGGKYGEDWCGSSTSGVRKGWACDPAAWWKDPYGADIMPRYAEGTVDLGHRPGEAFTLRDVDCLDGLVAKGTFLYASGQLVSGQPPCRT